MILLEYIMFIHNITSKTRLSYVVHICVYEKEIQSTAGLHDVTTDMNSRSSLLVCTAVVSDKLFVETFKQHPELKFYFHREKIGNPKNVNLCAVCGQPPPTHNNVSRYTAVGIATC
jgi:hypothetical protein